MSGNINISNPTNGQFLVYDVNSGGFINIDAEAVKSLLGIDVIDNSYLSNDKSSVPITDNTLDLGSNGRRFANIYATNVHGTVSSASLAETLKRNGAEDGQVLAWSDTENKWLPVDSKTVRLNAMTDIDMSNVSDGTILVYNENLGKWEAVPLQYVYETYTPSIPENVVELDEDNLIPIELIPDSVQSVIWVDIQQDLPATGDSQKLYIVKSSNRMYRWNGSNYTIMNNSDLAIAATKLSNARTISMSGDASWNVVFDGTNNVNGIISLKNSGVVAGTYSMVTVDAQGRVIAGQTSNDTTDGWYVSLTANQTVKGVKTFEEPFILKSATGVLGSPSSESVLRSAFNGTDGVDNIRIHIQATRDNNSNSLGSGAFINFATSTTSGFGTQIGARRGVGGASSFVVKTGNSQNVFNDSLVVDDSGNTNILGKVRIGGIIDELDNPQTLITKQYFEDKGVLTGQYGIGSTTSNITNFNSYLTNIPTGFFSFGAPTTANSPKAGSSGCGINIRHTDQWSSQLTLGRTSSDGIWWRPTTNSNTSWFEVIHTGNVKNNFNGTMDNYPISQAAVKAALDGKLNVTAVADSAAKLSTARNLKVSLSSTSAVSFNGSANAENIGVTGTLPISNGGTGATTVANARTALGLGTAATKNVMATATADTGIMEVGAYGWGKKNGGIVIGGGANLNSYLVSGFYQQTSNANAANGTNYPESKAGCLFVYPTSGNSGIGQTYYTFDGAMYIRTQSNGTTDTWTPWRTIIHSGNLATTTGSSTDTTMTQKSVTDALATKAASNHSHGAATQSSAGFMSAADKTKLDGLSGTVTIPRASNNTDGTVRMSLVGTTLYISNNGTTLPT